MNAPFSSCQYVSVAILLASASPVSYAETCCCQAESAAMACVAGREEVAGGKERDSYREVASDLAGRCCLGCEVMSKGEGH